MNMLTMLLARILAGERYQPATKEDSRIWLSLLGTFPFFLVGAFFTAPHTKDASLPLIWLSWAVGGLAFLAIWMALFRAFRLPGLGVIAVVGWLAAFAAAFYTL
ncbi:MAG: hypothetical protein JNK23_21615 [Opitutaceae bacterium]|nr:hypothetical protein [Opitutaceae bacterium]